MATPILVATSSQQIKRPRIVPTKKKLVSSRIAIFFVTNCAKQKCTHLKQMICMIYSHRSWFLDPSGQMDSWSVWSISNGRVGGSRIMRMMYMHVARVLLGWICTAYRSCTAYHKCRSGSRWPVLSRSLSVQRVRRFEEVDGISLVIFLTKKNVWFFFFNHH